MDRAKQLNYLHYDTKTNKIVEPVVLGSYNLPDPLVVNDLDVLNTAVFDTVVGEGFRDLTGELDDQTGNDILFNTSLVVGDRYNVICQTVQEVNGPENPVDNEFNATFAGVLMTINSVVSGALQLESEIIGVGVVPGTSIVSFGTGTGGVGTYNMNIAQILGPLTVTAAQPGLGVSFVGEVITGSSGELLRVHELQDVNNISGHVRIPFVGTSDIEEANLDEGLFIRPDTTFEQHATIPKLTCQDVNGTLPLNYSGLVNVVTLHNPTGKFETGEKITGGTSGATATILSDIAGQLIVAVLTGTFVPAETITGNHTGASANLDSLGANSQVVFNDVTQFLGGTASTPDSHFANHISFGGGELFSYDEAEISPAPIFLPSTGSSINDFTMIGNFITRTGAIVNFSWGDSLIGHNGDVFPYYIAAGVIPAFYRPEYVQVFRVTIHRDANSAIGYGGFMEVNLAGDVILYQEGDDKSVMEGWFLTDNGKYVGLMGGSVTWRR